MRRRALALALAALVLGGCGEEEPAPVQSPFAYDPAAPLGTIAMGRPVARDGLQAQTITYAGADGERVPALLALPETNGPVPCLVYQGGFGSKKEDAAALFPAAAELEMGLFTIDVRGQGARAGDGSELRTALADPEAFTTLLRETVRDLRRGLDYLGTRRECDPQRTGVVGFSQGGLLATLLSGADPRLSATALLGAGGDWSRIIGQPDSLILPNLSGDRLTRALRILRPYEPRTWVARISPRPVLLEHGSKDETTTQPQADALEEAARSPKQSVAYDGPHDPFGNKEAVDALVGFLRRELIAAP